MKKDINEIVQHHPNFPNEERFGHSYIESSGPHERSMTSGDPGDESPQFNGLNMNKKRMKTTHETNELSSDKSMNIMSQH